MGTAGLHAERPGEAAPAVSFTGTGAGSATLTVSFRGSGSLTNYACATSVGITAWGVDIVPKASYSGHAISPLFDGTAGKKWVVATFPEPQQAGVAWDVRLVGKESGTARLKYQRGTAPEEEIQWSGAQHNLCFENGLLNASVRLNDGPGVAPSMTFSSGVITVSGVQQGDRIIVEEEAGCRDEVAVVKNFSWNDLQRLGVGNLRMHPDFDSLLPEITTAIIETVVFCLNTSPSRSQKLQLAWDVFHDSGVWTNLYHDFHNGHPNMLTQDIPSSRSIGGFPWDCDHFHLALETYCLPASIAGQADLLRNAGDAVSGESFQATQAATCQCLVTLLNSTCSNSNDPFLLFHTYERPSAFHPTYMSPSATAHLLPGDPSRNVRRSFLNAQTPVLTYPGSEDNANEWRKSAGASPEEVWEIPFFVTKKGEIALVSTQGLMMAFVGMISDALALEEE
jgi:hypothetical protein